MGNGNIGGTKIDSNQRSSDSKNRQFGELFNRKRSTDNLIFYATTDKARV